MNRREIVDKLFIEKRKKKYSHDRILGFLAPDTFFDLLTFSSLYL